MTESFTKVAGIPRNVSLASEPVNVEGWTLSTLAHSPQSPTHIDWVSFQAHLAAEFQMRIAHRQSAVDHQNQSECRLAENSKCQTQKSLNLESPSMTAQKVKIRAPNDRLSP